MKKLDASAKRKAQAYQEQQVARQEESTAEKPVLSSEEEYHDLVGRRIDEAIRNGAFDNLRGKGKPLNLQRNPYVPQEMEMAYSIMQKNNIAPEWISDRAELLRRIEAFRQQLQAAVHACQAKRQASSAAAARAQAAQGWHQQLQEFEAKLHQLNRQIEIVNLKQPVLRLEVFKLRLDEELTRAGWLAD